MDYKESGVDIKKGEALVDWLQDKDQKLPHQERILSGIGGFASIFQMGFSEMEEPCLVSATDGVGTKLFLAIAQGDYSGIGQDLVAMCANDLICTGAQPLFFLDYFATSKLDLKQAQGFLDSVKRACVESQMALIGGETAEMPGLYKDNDFDCAGFAVGVVDKKKIIGAHKVKAGDVVLGVSSSGFHSNGFSLIRKLFSTTEDLDQWGEALLKPTALYVNLAMDLVTNHLISALAHITGGGIHNLSRVLPEGVGVQLNTWEWPELFTEAQKRGQLTAPQMLETFNCGVGLTIILPETEKVAVTEKIQSYGFNAYDLGKLEKSSQPLSFPEEWQ